MSRVGSILAADFGSVQTRVTLFDIVDGEYRLVARGTGLTTLGDPFDDLHVGLRRILTDMERMTGRQFYNQTGRIVTPEDQNRSGVDLFITTASAGRPMRAVIVGLVPDMSIATILRSISSTYIEPVAQIHLRDGLAEEARLNALVLTRPDLLIIAGGTEHGAETAMIELLDIVTLALTVLDRELRPPVLYAGNSRLHDTVRERFDDVTELFIAENVRPSAQQESLNDIQTQLAAIYDDHREAHGAGFQSVVQMSTSGLIPTAHSYRTIAQYYAQTRNGNVIAVDMGSTSSVLVGHFGGDAMTRISTTSGVGHSARSMLDEIGNYPVEMWLPFYPQASEIDNYALNKSIQPASIPMDLRDLFIEHALLRAGLRDMVQQSRAVWPDVADAGTLPPVSMVVVGGSPLTQTGHPMYDMLLIADCVQPSGVTEIKADSDGLVPALGVLAHYSAEATVQLLESDLHLKQLGTLISFDGKPNFEQNVAQLTITTEDDVIDYELKGGHLLSLPLPEDFSLTVTIACRRGFSVGGKRRLTLTLEGGQGGVLFDARGRPFAPPATVKDRAIRLPQWIHEATDDPLIVIPDAWLLEPEKQTVEQTVEQQLSFAEAEELTAEPLDDAPPEEADIDDFFARFEEEEDTEQQQVAKKSKQDDDDDDEFSSLRNLLG